MKMISKEGSYLHNSFMSKGIKWTIIGSQSNGLLVLDTYDCFKSDKGEYRTVMRKQIIELENSGKIKPISEN